MMRETNDTGKRNLGRLNIRRSKHPPPTSGLVIHGVFTLPSQIAALLPFTLLCGDLALASWIGLPQVCVCHTCNRELCGNTPRGTPMTNMGFLRALLAVGLFVLCATTVAQQPALAPQPANGKKDDTKKDTAKLFDSKDVKKDAGKVEGIVKKEEATQIKTFEMKDANITDLQQVLARFAPSKSGKPLLVVADPKTKVLFIRGTQADVEVAAKIIAQLEGEGKTPGPLEVIHLQYTPVDDAMRVLTALELNARVFPCPGHKALILAQGEASLDQVKAVVEKLENAKSQLPAKSRSPRPRRQ
jgi:hypothetical protein